MLAFYGENRAQRTRRARPSPPKFLIRLTLRPAACALSRIIIRPPASLGPECLASRGYCGELAPHAAGRSVPARARPSSHADAIRNADSRQIQAAEGGGAGFDFYPANGIADEVLR
jgi:hypothetical protein